MSFELIGFVTLLLGGLTIYRGADFGIYALGFLTLLGMAAAIKLPALGSASIQPAHLFLPFYFLATVRKPTALRHGLQVVTYPRPGYWLTLFVVFGVLCTLFLPRIFAGETEVFSLGRTAYGPPRIMSAPLAPSSGNVTQSVYLLGDLGIFLAVSLHLLGGGQRHIINAILFAAAANIGFAVLDIVTFWTNTTELFDVIRNANYSFAADVTVGILKRVAGSFPEASTFGAATLAFFVFTVELWLSGFLIFTTGMLAFCSLILLLLSTSSSAYLGLAAYGFFVFVRSHWALTCKKASSKHILIAFIIPIAVFILIFGLMLLPSVSQPLMDLADRLIFNKLVTNSGIERGAWNSHGLANFLDTYGLGAGIGSVRTSSIVIALLASVGIIGTVFFAVFLYVSLAGMRIKPDSVDSETHSIVKAGIWTILVPLFPAAVIATTVDLGLMYFIFAALATAPLITENSRDELGQPSWIPHWKGTNPSGTGDGREWSHAFNDIRK